MIKPIQTLLLFVFCSMAWVGFGEDIIAGLYASSPRQLSILVAVVGSLYLAVVFLGQLSRALVTRRASVRVSPGRLARRNDPPHENFRAREAALALLGPEADRLLVIAKAREIADSWAERPTLRYEDSCRHEAAHAVAANHFGAIALGATVNRNGNGQMRWALPATGMSESEELWMRLCIAISGSVLDHLEGRHNSGSTMDTNQALGDAVTLLATGQPPEGLHGNFTLDSVLAHARALVGQVLADRKDVLNQIADRLAESGELDGYQINRILCLSPAVTATTTASQS